MRRPTARGRVRRAGISGRPLMNCTFCCHALEHPCRGPRGREANRQAPGQIARRVAEHDAGIEAPAGGDEPERVLRGELRALRDCCGCSLVPSGRIVTVGEQAAHARSPWHAPPPTSTLGRSTLITAAAAICVRLLLVDDCRRRPRPAGGAGATHGASTPVSPYSASEFVTEPELHLARRVRQPRDASEIGAGDCGVRRSPDLPVE